MIVVYPVLFTQTKDEKDTYLIEIPDLEGYTEGYGLSDAIHMARDYIGCVYYSRRGEQIPEPRTLNEIQIEDGAFANEGATVASYVDLDVDAYMKMMDNKGRTP